MIFHSGDGRQIDEEDVTRVIDFLERTTSPGLQAPMAVIHLKDALRGPQCGVVYEWAGALKCYLPKGHMGEHAVDPARWLNRDAF